MKKLKERQQVKPTGSQAKFRAAMVESFRLRCVSGARCVEILSRIAYSAQRGVEPCKEMMEVILDMNEMHGQPLED